LKVASGTNDGSLQRTIPHGGTVGGVAVRSNVLDLDRDDIATA